MLHLCKDWFNTSLILPLFSLNVLCLLHVSTCLPATATSLSGSVVKKINLPRQGTWVWPLVWEEPLQKKMATHSSILAWRTAWSLVCYSPQCNRELGKPWQWKSSISRAPTRWPMTLWAFSLKPQNYKYKHTYSWADSHLLEVTLSVIKWSESRVSYDVIPKKHRNNRKLYRQYCVNFKAAKRLDLKCSHH